jgi:ubiquinone/menaquinone biosynthesis C-methylase UbiE
MQEPLKELSLFTFYWAKHFCEPSCRLYHQNWSITRFIQNGNQLPDHAAYFIEKIQNYHALGHKNLLISGAADTGMLAIVHEALMSNKTGLQNFSITLIDRCPTVIEQNRLYAKSIKLPINLICGDILSTPLHDFDMVMAHSFINFFSEEKKQDLFHAWSSLLTEKGVLLIYNKTQDDPKKLMERRLDPTKIQERLTAAKQKIEDHGLPQEILNSISDFYNNEKIREQFTRVSLMEMIKTSRLKIIDHQETLTTGSFGPTSTRLDAQPRTTHLLTLSKDE